MMPATVEREDIKTCPREDGSSVLVEELAELLHDRCCQGGRCGRLDRRACWAWTAGRWHRQADEVLAAVAGAATSMASRPLARDQRTDRGREQE